MKAETLQKRIERELYNKAGRPAKKYIDVIYLLEKPKTKLRPVSWSKNSRYFNLNDRSKNIMDGLQKLKLTWESGNDAPRGGKAGFYIVLTRQSQIAVAPWAKKYYSDIYRGNELVIKKRKN